MAPRKMVRLLDYIACANRGMSKSQAGRELGVSVQTVDVMSKKYRIEFKDGRRKEHKSANELSEKAPSPSHQPQEP